MDMDTNLSEEFVLGSNSSGETRGSQPWQTDVLYSSRFWTPFVFTPILFLIGVICDGFSIKIFANRSMRCANNIYLTALSVSDLLYQVFSFTMTWKYYHFMGSVWLYWWYTPFGLWLTEAAGATSIWIIVALTIERFIAVSRHLNRQIYHTEKRAKYASGITFLSCFTFTGIFSYEWRGAFEPIEGNPTNETVYLLERTEAWKEERFKKAYQWIYIVFFFMIPIFILGALNSYLVRFVRNARRERKILSRQRNYAPSQRKLNEYQVTIILMWVSMIHIISNLPSNLLEIYILVDEPVPGSTEENTLMELGNIFSLMSRINSICNILLYIELNRNYRKLFCTLFCRRGVENSGSSTPSSPRIYWRDGVHPAEEAIEMHNIADDHH